MKYSRNEVEQIRDYIWARIDRSAYADDPSLGVLASVLEEDCCQSIADNVVFILGFDQQVYDGFISGYTVMEITEMLEVDKPTVINALKRLYFPVPREADSNMDIVQLRQFAEDLEHAPDWFVELYKHGCREGLYLEDMLPEAALYGKLFRAGNSPEEISSIVKASTAIVNKVLRSAGYPTGGRPFLTWQNTIDIMRRIKENGSIAAIPLDSKVREVYEAVYRDYTAGKKYVKEDI